ncbi:MAG: cyclic peptide export ABC transporter [Vicinamibacterales bacterium]
MRFDPARWAPLLRLLQHSESRFNVRLVWMAALSGFANAGLLAVINAAADNSALDAANGRFVALFAIVVLVFLRAQRYILLTSVAEVERILDEIRLRISGLIARSDLRQIEQVGRAQIYASLHRETVTISQATSGLVIAAQSLLMVLFSLVYLAWLSRAALVLLLLAMAIAIRAYLKRSALTNRLMHEAVATENEYFDALNHLLDGFKEAKLRRERASALSSRLRRISGRLHDVKVESGSSFAMQFVYGQLAVYLLLGAVVFLLPRLSADYSQVVIKATASILFIIGPLNNLLGTMPQFSAANIAAESIFQLEAQLELAANGAPGPDAGTAAPAGAADLHAEALTFRFTDASGESSFSVGPISLDIPSGEVLFIVGGNGSGKSTLLKLLTGLYVPDSGTLRIGDRPLTRATAAWYRSHFAAVFSDYHLFDRLYGFPDSPPRLAELLRTLQIDQKTGVVDGRFTALDLSAGQRKRLALAVALLEERPILVCDEWAADQDPEFRRYFYEELIPRLKAAGTTVIAATHDDRYFHLADRVLKMEDGRFVDAGGARG